MKSSTKNFQKLFKYYYFCRIILPTIKQKSHSKVLVYDCMPNSILRSSKKNIFYSLKSPQGANFSKVKIDVFTFANISVQKNTRKSDIFSYLMHADCSRYNSGSSFFFSYRRVKSILKISLWNFIIICHVFERFQAIVKKVIKDNVNALH